MIYVRLCKVLLGVVGKTTPPPNAPPKDVHVPVPRTRELCRYDEVKDLEMGRGPWVIEAAQY